MRIQFIVISLTLFATCRGVVSSHHAFGAEREALLIGNSKYGVNALRNPKNDVDVLERVLKSLQFNVVVEKDLKLEEMETALRQFKRRTSQGGVGLIFFAGHGIQRKGENFLVPVDSNLTSLEEYEVPYKLLSVGMILEAMDSSGANLNVLVLDCCRSNPFAESWARSSQTGLAGISEVPKGTVVAYSTAPGEVAIDGLGVNSPYTKQLVRVLSQRPPEGLELIDALRSVGRNVYRDSKQRPWINFDLSIEQFYLWQPATMEWRTGHVSVIDRDPRVGSKSVGNSITGVNIANFSETQEKLNQTVTASSDRSSTIEKTLDDATTIQNTQWYEMESPPEPFITTCFGITNSSDDSLLMHSVNGKTLVVKPHHTMYITQKTQNDVPLGENWSILDGDDEESTAPGSSFRLKPLHTYEFVKKSEQEYRSQLDFYVKQIEVLNQVGRSHSDAVIDQTRAQVFSLANKKHEQLLIDLAPWKSPWKMTGQQSWVHKSSGGFVGQLWALNAATDSKQSSDQE